jgi:predicted alpha/beta superfamily hydrolase
MNRTIIPISDGSGTLERFEQFPSQFVAARHVDVWLPPHYKKDSGGRYPVVYMHDGQNLFDPTQASSGIDWGIDEAVSRLVDEKQVPAPLIVGIWNTNLRQREYMPQKALEMMLLDAFGQRLTKSVRKQPISDDYLRFIISELKPCIDATFRTLPGQAHTFSMGSSMGGLISLYAALEYPHIFAGAGCLSTHWPASPARLIQYVQTTLPAPGNHRFYFDFGTQGLDAGYERFQRRVDALMQAAGYQSGIDWLTLKFEGAEHHEQAWRERVHQPLKFLLGGKNMDRAYRV